MKSLVIALGLAIVLGGCATVKNVAVEGNPSGFMGKDAAVLMPGEVAKGQAGLRYYNPAAKWQTYNKVLLEPVTFWGDEGSKVAPQTQQDLGSYFNTSLQKSFGEKFEVVTAPGPGVMKLQIAVIDAESATPGLRTVSLVIPQARVLSTVGSAAMGKQVFAGTLQVEAKLTDAQTGQLLSAVVARSIGGAAMKAAAQWEWGDAENAMDLFSKRAANNLQALTAGKATAADLPLPD